LHSYLSAMACPYTRSRARSEVPESDVEPSDTAPSSATSPPPSIFVGPNVEAVEGSESVSTESAGPVSAPTLSLLGQSRCTSVCGTFSSGGLRPGYPSGLADPPDSSMHTGGQMSTSLATGIVAAEVHAELEQSSSSYPSSSRQPPTTASAARLAPEVLHKSHPVDEKYDRGVVRVRRTVLEFYTPCNFSATANARDFKFCTRVGHAKS